MSLPRAAVTAALLAALLAVGLLLRLWSLGHGLPWVFNPDEELHFVPVAIEMFNGSFNPGYFENPPALTYLLHLVFRARFASGFPFGNEIAPELASAAQPVWLTARVVVALIGTLVIGLVFWAGSRYYDRRVGLVAAALIAFSFLPVYYSKQALNDVVTLVPVTLALVACLVALRGGRRGQWILAGAALGAATATKYTAGAMVVVVGVAAALRILDGRDSLRRAVTGVALAGAAFCVAFFVLNPFALLDFREFASQLGGQSGQAENAKLGQGDTPGPVYYAWTLTWGMGLLPALAAVAGGVIAVREDRGRGLLLVVFPILFFLFLSTQGRYFGRWLLPAYPALAILAGLAAVRLAEALPLRQSGRAWALAVVAALLVLQGLVSSIRVDAVLGEPDTRALAHQWLREEVPPGSRIVVEPFIPGDYLDDAGGEPRWERWPVRRPFQAYQRTQIGPGQVAEYRRSGYCWVVVGSHQKQRGLAAGLATSRRYYDELDAASASTAVFSPYRPSADPVPFNFDLSFNWLPAAHVRPGPVVEVHRLSDCEPQTGPPPAGERAAAPPASSSG